MYTYTVLVGNIHVTVSVLQSLTPRKPRGTGVSLAKEESNSHAKRLTHGNFICLVGPVSKTVKSRFQCKDKVWAREEAGNKPTYGFQYCDTLAERTL